MTVVRRTFLFVLALLLLGSLGSGPAQAQISLAGGYNSILGLYASAGWGFPVMPATTLTVGATYTEALGLEPLLSLTRTSPLAPGWSLSLTAARGGFGGDYGVDRLPEVTLSGGGRVGATPLNYGLEAGLGHFLVRPAGLSGVRGTLAAQVSTSPIPLGPFLSAGASTGYRQNLYSGPTLHGAWWGSAWLSVAPAPVLSTVFTYFRQEASGTSPLLFDAMGKDEYVAGAATLTVGQGITLQHSQTYSLISRAISARVYGATVALERRQAFGVSWDDVPRKLTVSYTRAGVGSFSVTWEVPTQRVWFSFSR